MRFISKIMGVWGAVIVISAVLTGSAAYGADISAAGLEEITDQYMEGVMQDYHVAGAAVCVVKDGQIFFEKGYGYSDLSTKSPVSPETSGFQIASVTKLFTAAAVMQMVEQGKLSLDEDVNAYLKVFQIDNPYTTPVTLRNLLTHTGGFDDRVPLYVKSTGDILFDAMEPLETVLKREMPPVIREPGTFCEYSVYGMALAGHLVELASGLPIDQYMKENVFKPLGMDHSAYGLDQSIIGDMVKPYIYKRGRYVEGAYTLISDHPSGAICASASDMGRFVSMFLNDGQYKGVTVLDGGSVTEMLTTQYAGHPKLPGFGLGFCEALRNGYTCYEHGGMLPPFQSKVSVLPEKEIGVCISINTKSPESGRVCNEWIDMVYGYLTAKARDPEAEAVLGADIPFDMDTDAINGKYVFCAYGRHDPTKIKSLMVTCGIRCDDTGNLVFKADGIDWKYQYAGGGLFYNQDHGYIQIRERNGRMVLSALNFDYEKVSGAGSCLLTIAMISLPIYLLLSICLILSVLRKKKSNQPLILRTALLVSGVAVISHFVLNAVMAVRSINADTSAVYSLIMPLLHASCYLLLGGMITLCIYIVPSWMDKRLTLWSKILDCVMIVFGLVNIVLMYTMNGFAV